MKRNRHLIVLACLVTATALADEVFTNSEPRWWRGNLHTHTLWSDGDGFPEVVAQWYRDAGYNFLSLSDHNVLSQGEKWKRVKDVDARAKTNAFAQYLNRFGPHWVETRTATEHEAMEVRLKPIEEYRALVEERDRFLMIQAEEITHEAKNGRALHLNVVNLLEVIAPRDGATIRETIANNLAAVEESARRTGREIIVHVNHPNYKWGVTSEDLAAVVGERFFEVWNGVDNDGDPGDEIHPSTDEMWDVANTLRLAGMGAPPLFAVATDDSHDHHGNKTRALPGRAWVMVQARHLTPESIVQAIRTGDFYASTGVELDEVVFDKPTGKLALRIRAKGDATFVTQFIGTRKGVNLTGKPRLDKAGRIVETTLDYRSASGSQIGEVFCEVKGVNPSYTLRGDELYVRAVITSSAAPRVPSSEFPFQRAWTQPVGWRAHGAD